MLFTYMKWWLSNNSKCSLTTLIIIWSSCVPEQTVLYRRGRSEQTPVWTASMHWWGQTWDQAGSSEHSLSDLPCLSETTNMSEPRKCNHICSKLNIKCVTITVLLIQANDKLNTAAVKKTVSQHQAFKGNNPIFTVPWLHPSSIPQPWFRDQYFFD